MLPQPQPTAARSTSRAVATAAAAAPRLLYATAAAACHDLPGHPECAARVPAILQALEAHGLTARRDEVVQLTGFAPAERTALQRVHSAGYIAGLERASSKCADSNTTMGGDTYVTGSTAGDACLAAGAAVALVDAVVAAASRQQPDAGAVPAGFAVCRPPGHHCLPSEAMGFCLIGNVAIAARHAQARHGLQRVLILDWDVHHGNGTQAIFESDPDVLFISSHQAGTAAACTLRCAVDCRVGGERAPTAAAGPPWSLQAPSPTRASWEKRAQAMARA